jgi:hypothetical protein
MKQGNRQKPDWQVEKQADRSVKCLSNLQAGGRKKTAGRNKTYKRIVSRQGSQKPGRSMQKEASRKHCNRIHKHGRRGSRNVIREGRAKITQNCGLVEFCWV